MPHRSHPWSWIACSTAAAMLAAAAARAAAARGVAPAPPHTGEGLFVSGGEVYDANGLPFRIRGVNHTHSFGWQPANEAAIPHIANSGANSVRMVFFKSGAGITLTASQQRNLVTQYIARDIVPIVELHDYTGGNSDTTGQAIVEAVDYWLQPDRRAYLKEFEREVVLNIANEWGPNSTVWRDAYIDGVQRLRAAGVNNLIMIDAGGNFGQNPNAIQQWGWDILNADPQHNVLFSQHMYGFWFTRSNVPSWAFGVREELQQTKDLGLPLVIGEFGWEEHSEVNYDTSDAMQIYEDLGIGWMAWAWYRGMNPGDTLSLIANVNGGHAYEYNSDADLTSYGNLVINHPVYGLKNAAQKASIFGLPGDFNEDGLVDAADYTVWRDGLGGPYTQDHYQVWRNHYGLAMLGGTPTAVPAPAAQLAVVAVLAACSLLRVTRVTRVGVPAASSQT